MLELVVVRDVVLEFSWLEGFWVSLGSSRKSLVSNVNCGCHFGWDGGHRVCSLCCGWRRVGICFKNFGIFCNSWGWISFVQSHRDQCLKIWFESIGFW